MGHDPNFPTQAEIDYAYSDNWRCRYCGHNCMNHPMDDLEAACDCDCHDDPEEANDDFD